jgi:hypothetical protein
MIRCVIAAAMLAAVASSPVFAADAATPSPATHPEKKLTPQQQKMGTCSHEAKMKGLKGADRKAFMKTCLKAS